ncbi:MAG: tetratricopeptide repeat protein [Bacteroidota bacterium]
MLPIITRYHLITAFILLATSSTLMAQIAQTAEQWQEDLDFIHQTIHQNYPFLFKKTTPEDFDEKVKALSRAIPSLEDHEVITGFARIISSFEYGHTSLRLGGKAGFGMLPVNLYHFNDGLYVEGVHEKFAAALGGKVTHIAGMPIEEVLAKVRPVIPAENDQYTKGYGISYALMPKVLHAQGVTPKLQESIVFTVEQDGKSSEHPIAMLPEAKRPTRYGFTAQQDGWLTMRSQDTTPFYLKHLDKRYYFEYLSEQKTLYVRQSSVFHDESETIQEFYARVFDFVDNNDVEKMVLDVRLNGGGNNFNNKEVITGIIRSEKINQVGNLYVILGRRTFSACQNLVNELHNYTNAIFVGEPTAENINFYGDAHNVQLPNSQINLRLSWAWWQDKAQWQNDDWLAPQLAVSISAEDYQKNQDPILERALNFDTENFILDPMAYISELFSSGQMEKLQREVARLVNDPDYSFFPFERRFDQAGHQLLKGGQVMEAQMVFGMNAQLFPESATAWHSLARAMLKSGQTDKAKALLQKVVQMAPEGEAGQAAKATLMEME